MRQTDVTANKDNPTDIGGVVKLGIKAPSVADCDTGVAPKCWRRHKPQPLTNLDLR